MNEKCFALRVGGACGALRGSCAGVADCPFYKTKRQQAADLRVRQSHDLFPSIPKGREARLPPQRWSLGLLVAAAAAPAASAAVAAASALAIALVAHHLEDDRAHEHGERAADDPCRHCVYLPKRPYAPTLTFWVRRLSS